MKHAVVKIFIALCIAVIGMLHAEDNPLYSVAQFEAASKAFRADPITNAKPNCGVMLGFATESPDVSVMISRRTGVVWINDKGSDKKELTPLLLCAYISGSVQSQLASGKKENDSLAGIAASIQVYQVLKKTNAQFKLESMEKLIKAHKAGKTQEYLNSLPE